MAPRVLPVPAPGAGSDTAMSPKTWRSRPVNPSPRCPLSPAAGRYSHVERPVKWVAGLCWRGFGARRTRRSGAVCFLSRRRGPGVKNAAPAGVAEDERFLTPGWRLLHAPRRRRGRPGFGACRTRQPLVDRATATLMFACRNRRVWSRRRSPLTAPATAARRWQRISGGLLCGGGWLARRGRPDHPGHRWAR